MSLDKTRWAYVLACAGVVGLGLLCRAPQSGLPWPVAKYMGSTLWGAMVYLALRALSPRLARPARWALLVALAVEFSRLLHAPALDAFRATLAGRLLLGRLFSAWNIVAYAAGILTAAAVDRRVQPPV